MNISKPSICRICGEGLLLTHTLPNYPLCSGPVSPKDMLCKVENVSIGYCQKCDLCATISPEHGQIDYSDNYTTSVTDGKRKTLLSFIDSHFGSSIKKVLDVGCYDGQIAGRMKRQHKWDVQGCDPCEWAVNRAREKYGIEVKQAEFSKELYQGQRFDLVTASNVLEHVENPDTFLKDVLSILKPKGSVILVVPDGIKRIREGILGSIVPEHFWYFGIESLSRLLCKVGFGAVEVVADNGTLMVLASLTGTTMDETTSKEVSIPNYKHGIARLGILHQLVWDDKKIILYGANTCALELLASKTIDQRKVVCAIDDDHYKWGKALVNTDIIVHPRDYVKEIQGTFIICSYYSQDELSSFVQCIALQPYKIVTLYPPKVQT